jgi:2-polyprenyl-3-methyl-5-hydroxy-6-metoxy-1,4-benzoquinol methylase
MKNLTRVLEPGKSLFTFNEPHRSCFVKLIRSGAAFLDIQPTDRQAQYACPAKNEKFLDRELRRVDMHLENICCFIDFMRPVRVLDAGCGTGALSVALSLTFPDATVTGFDLDSKSIEAAVVRADGYGVGNRLSLQNKAVQEIEPDSGYDLVTCTSVIEFIICNSERQEFLQQLGKRVAPGGFLVLTTPNPWYLFELHTKKFLQNYSRNPSLPWASRAKSIGVALGAGFTKIDSRHRTRFKLHRQPLLKWMPVWLAEQFFPWQFLIYRKNETGQD